MSRTFIYNNSLLEIFYRYLPSRSNSSIKCIMSFLFKLEFWNTIRKKFGLVLYVWYVTIMVPSFIIASLILGATACTLFQKSWSVSSLSSNRSLMMLVLRLSGKYQKHTLVHSGSGMTMWKLCRDFIVS